MEPNTRTTVGECPRRTQTAVGVGMGWRKWMGREFNKMMSRKWSGPSKAVVRDFKLIRGV